MASSSESARPLQMSVLEIGTIYSWLRTFCKHDVEDKEALSTAQQSFKKHSDLLLPSEVDATLAAFFDARAGEPRSKWVTEASYDQVCAKIGYKTYRRDGQVRFRALKAWAERMQGLYHEHGTVDDKYAVDAWRHLLFARHGITATKLRRIGDVAELPSVCADFEKAVWDSLAQNRFNGGLLPVLDLPDARSVLFAAYIATQEPEVRLRTCRQFFRDLAKLYKAAGNDDAVAHIEGTCIHLDEPEAFQYFDELPLAQQSRVVQTGRRSLYDACETVQKGRQLPTVDTLTREFFSAMIHPDLPASQRLPQQLVAR